MKETSEDKKEKQRTHEFPCKRNRRQPQKDEGRERERGKNTARVFLVFVRWGSCVGVGMVKKLYL